ncbi:MAG TPA: hypothetical protein VM008_03305 [Phycisphaerae bacterium]|nr:hypothetical protein [Phycisphaerae bacterium]
MPHVRRLTAPLLLVLFAFILTALCRMAGPSDLYDKEQPRTISYTVDILLHHRWSLPTDNFDIPATKPPLFNWISAPIVAAFGYHEWTLKFPSLLAAAIVLLCILIAARIISPPATTDITGTTDITSTPNPTSLGVLASLLWLSTFMTAKLMYLARPDMLVTACLTLAWLTATQIILSPKPRPLASSLLWLSITAAALTKGPIALLPILYLIVAAKYLAGSFHPLKRAGLWWGIPLLLAAVGLWSVLAYQQDPEFFRQVLLGRELSQRLLPGAAGSNIKHFGWLVTLPNGPFYIIARFLPWSLLPLAALICWIINKFRKRSRPPITDITATTDITKPATLWILIIALSFCFLSTKRPDRYAPVFPALALITAQLALRYAPRLRLRFAHLAALPLLFLFVIFINNQFLDSPAKSHLGDNLLRFTTAVSQKTGDDTILFEDGEQTPLQTLLARHQPLTPSPDYLQSAKWSIRFFDPHAPSIPAAVSGPIAQIDGPKPGRLALYPLAPNEGPAEFERAQRVPRLYTEENSRDLLVNPDPATTRWLQFWRQHTAPTSQPTSQP